MTNVISHGLFGILTNEYLTINWYIKDYLTTYQ